MFQKEITENWENILYKVVNLEDIDPWEIDLVELADKYLEFIENKGVDFRISGKVVLAAAILLKMKAEILAAEEKEEEEEEFEPISFDYSAYEAPEIEPRVKKVPKRKATFTELVGALKDALTIKKERPKRIKPKTEDIVLKKEFMEHIESLYEKLKKMAEKDNQVKFSRLIKRKNSKRIIGKFLPLLHLAQEKKINIDQKKLFGEIYIMLKNNK